jgi:hypothetical protein
MLQYQVICPLADGCGLYHRSGWENGHARFEKGDGWFVCSSGRHWWISFDCYVNGNDTVTGKTLSFISLRFVLLPTMYLDAFFSFSITSWRSSGEPPSAGWRAYPGGTAGRASLGSDSPSLVLCTLAHRDDILQAGGDL